MEDELEKALAESERIVAQGLASARAELAAINERKSHLEALIVQAEALQRSAGAATPLTPAHLTLHEAISVVLNEQGNRWMTVRELAEAVNARSLYRKKDGSAVEVNQIHARTKNYGQLFEKNGPNVRLRASSVRAGS